MLTHNVEKITRRAKHPVEFVPCIHSAITRNNGLAFQICRKWSALGGKNIQ